MIFTSLICYFLFVHYVISQEFKIFLLLTLIKKLRSADEQLASSNSSGNINSFVENIDQPSNEKPANIN